MSKSPNAEGYAGKNDKFYSIAKKGKQILKFDRKSARFVLYSNIKNIEDIKKIYSDYVGFF